jgi:hypothetical protein
MQEIERFLRFGMYPEVLIQDNNKRKEQYLNEITSSYLIKDILVLTRIKFPEKLIQLLKLLAYQIGSEVSVEELSNSLQIHREAVLNYLDLLEKSFVIFRLNGFNRNLRKEVTKMSKVYFYDLGIRNAVIGNFSEIALRSDAGQLWENFVIAERIKFNAYRQQKPKYFFWRIYGGSELDLVEEYGGKLTGFEMKWKSKQKRPPKAWSDSYPEADYHCINRENFFSVLQ